jgi:DNA segregation ATPase FtsK/SpoIIIE, S-DNA-T family
MPGGPGGLSSSPAAHGGPPGAGPLRVDALPARVDEGELWGAAALMPTGTTVVGVGGDSSSPHGLSPDRDGRRWLVCGAAGSGVSTTLLLIARSLVRQGRRVAAVSTRPGALELLRDRPEVALCCDSADPTGLVSLRRSVPSLAVVVDNAEELLDSPVEAALREIATLVDRDDGLLVCGANTASLSLQYRGLAVEVARHRTGILLGPSSVSDADVFGLRIGVDPGAVQGRGYLVRRGCVTPIQVARPSDDSLRPDPQEAGPSGSPSVLAGLRCDPRPHGRHDADDRDHADGGRHQCPAALQQAPRDGKQQHVPDDGRGVRPACAPPPRPRHDCQPHREDGDEHR